jgi:hypothetical protein
VPTVDGTLARSRRPAAKTAVTPPPAAKTRGRESADGEGMRAPKREGSCSRRC